MKTNKLIFIFLVSIVFQACGNSTDINQFDGIDNQGLSEDEILSKLKKFVNDGGDLTQGIGKDEVPIFYHVLRIDTPKMISFLLENGVNANTTAKGAPCFTALYFTKSPQVAEILLEYGASIDLGINCTGRATNIVKFHKRINPKVYAVLKPTIEKLDSEKTRRIESIANRKFLVGDLAYVCAGTIFGEKEMCKAEVLNKRRGKIQVEYKTVCTSVAYKGYIEWINPENAGTRDQVRNGLNCG